MGLIMTFWISDLFWGPELKVAIFKMEKKWGRLYWLDSENTLNVQNLENLRQWKTDLFSRCVLNEKMLQKEKLGMWCILFLYEYEIICKKSLTALFGHFSTWKPLDYFVTKNTSIKGEDNMILQIFYLLNIFILKLSGQKVRCKIRILASGFN